jgi:hypothetical protein
MSEFDTANSFEEHLVEHHRLTSMPLLSIRDMCQRDNGRRPPSNMCPLCQETIPCSAKRGTRAFERAIKRHVSRHLEQLAFFVALPAGQMMPQDDDSEFQDDSESEDGLQSEIKSIVSKDTGLSKRELQIVNVQAFIADQRRASDSPERPGTPVNRIKPYHSNLAPHISSEDPEQDADGGVIAPVFPISVQMPPQNEHFYSRDALLTNVRKSLRSSGTVCLIHGVGGVGKTLAAVQYCYDNKRDYDAIFWLQADTAPGLADSYAQMAMSLGLANSPEDHNQVVTRGREWLQDTGMATKCTQLDCLTY